MRPAEVRLAFGVGAALCGIEVEVIAHDQVQPAVAVEIDERGRDAPVAVRQTGGRGDVGESAAAQIEEEPDAVGLGDQDLGQAVVVHIADSQAIAIAGHVGAGAGTHILEPAVGQLVVEPVRRRGGRMDVVDEINVEPTVVVEIQERAARANRL